ncbi:peptidase C39 family protein [soil metagenome]
MRHIRLSLAVAVTGALLATTSPATAATPDPATPPAKVTAVKAPTQRASVATDLRRFTSNKAFRSGSRNGVRISKGSLRIGKPAGVRRYTDPYGDNKSHRYAYGSWRSPWKRAAHAYRELVPSWSAKTPVGTFLEVQVRVRTGGGRTGSWDSAGIWAGGKLGGINRTSRGDQADDVARVLTDTVRTTTNARRWQLRVKLHRRKGTSRTPVVAAMAATTSQLAPSLVSTSSPGVARGTSIKVPRYSQMIHQGHYPQWDNGGEAWCSPTSTAMVLGRWGSGPTRKQYSWVPSGHVNPWVDHAARMTYDYRYQGAGNWPFSAAYASTFGLDAFVARLGSMRAAERYVAKGIPLVLSIAFDAGELDNAPLTSSRGHILVLRGFTKKGNPIVNDPAAARNDGVRRVYKRRQLERAWLTASAGTAYVIRPKSVDLPRS